MGIPDKCQEHITLAFCPRVKLYRSEALTLPRCWASGMGAPASVAAHGDWPQPPPSRAASRAASRHRASDPPPVRMETALSRGAAAALGPSAAHRSPTSGPPAARVGWPTPRAASAPPSSPAPCVASRKRAGDHQ